MGNTRSIFAVFLVLGGVLLLGILSNILAYAQQSSSPPPAASSPSTTTISADLKAKMCDPSNPSLKIVNTTESHICGIPKTVKPSPTLSATPPTSAVLSSSLLPATTKPTTIASAAAPKQQQIVTTRTTSTGTPATLAQVSNPGSRTSSSLPPPSPIAPQVKAVNQLQQSPITGINYTAGKNYTFAATSPPVASDKLMYLGYHGSSSSMMAANHHQKFHQSS
jgi:cytoskeletal protein RodZ